MNLTVITEPPFEPVSLEEAYVHLRVDPEGSPPTHPDDALISDAIKAARKHVEAMTRRSMVRQALRLSMPTFPVSLSAWQQSTNRNGLVRAIRLLRPPIVSVESVGYFDGNNVPQTVAVSDFYITDEQVPELRFVSTFAPPTLYDRPDAVRVEYTAGYTPEGSPPTTQAEYAANVPAGLKQAILLGTQLYYDALKPDEFISVESALERLVQPFRIQHLP
jgi:uncharacterized phiE125 gp8 family phage protein